MENNSVTRPVLPKLYVILDAALINSSVIECARELAGSGVQLLQYRNKGAAGRELLDTSRELVAALSPTRVSVVLNDRPDVAVLSGAAGVHVGQNDLTVEQARAIVGPARWVGISTHNLEQFQRAAATSADYIAVGPIFATSSKANPDPIVGPEFIRRVRPLTGKPIVVIGGITLERAHEVFSAGADSLAVISDILRAQEPGKRARQYLELLGAANRVAAV